MNSSLRIPDSPIGLDTFTYQKGVKMFFLSHMHTDHLNGLTNTWNLGTIYCSVITRKLLLHKFELPPGRVVGLEVNSTTLLYLDSSKKVALCVTLIDANHSPGSVMFLFDSYF
eukprot:TRINITY_DN6591_c1_g1_i1.p1 TRINITY_DN6591_c1_g1~~TRINITY_DN6591_c1_g1_i1.p1  ORF type:complete len:113 (-),score=10.17 TRINITY_DN6591_c1_g1_i1:430-768(-)